MDVSIQYKGKEIGKVDSSDVEMDQDIENLTNGNVVMYSFVKSRTVFTKFENIRLNQNVHEQANNLFSRTYDFVAKNIKIPKGLKLPKRKRIRKKIEKKYTYTFIYHNCQVRI